jgi:hypothetical protein
MNRGAVLAVALAVVMVASGLTIPVLGGSPAASERTNAVDDGAGPVSVPTPAPDSSSASITQEAESAVEDGVDEGINLVQVQGIEVSQEQRTAALDGALDSAAQHQEASAEQVQAATAGAVHGTLLQAQQVSAEQTQVVVGGALDGALSQHQVATASQLQAATWGASHGAVAQAQRVTAEQLQVAARGGAAGAASEAGEREVERVPVVQEAAQGAAYGALEQYQTLTAEQRQQVTAEHVQFAATGAAAGAIEGSTPDALEQVQGVDLEQRQEVTIKQVQKAATGAAKGALAQQQAVTVEQTQAAAFGAGSGALIQAQSVRIEQVQRITITQIQEAAFGAAKGAIVQSQAATVEQIQAAALGASQGVLVQQQTVSITQTQAAALGASSGAIESAVQFQIIDIEQIQATASGAGEGAATQTQLVDVVQVQTLAAGAASGALAQHQTATVEQIRVAAKAVCEETARLVQNQRISVTQLQVLVQESAADAAAHAAEETIDTDAELGQYLEIELEQRIDAIDELEGEARVSFSDQESDGGTVVVDAVELSEGGFVAIHDDRFLAGDPIESLRGVSEFLEPGEHDDVEIDLDEPLEEDQQLLAVAHLDTTENEAFDYADSGGEDDVPYVGVGGVPAADWALVTGEDEPDASLSVEDQEGDGETLLVGAVSAPVEFALAAEYDGERVESESFGADETVTGLDLDLDPAINANTTVEISVVDDEDTALVTETIEYTFEEPDPDPTAVLTVENQQGDGESLTVAEASASVLYSLTVTDEDDQQRAETEPFDAGEVLENESITLDPALDNETALDIALVDEEGEELASETIEYVLDPAFNVAFVDCSRAEVTASLEDGDQVAASTGFSDTGGFGNTIGEDVVTIGDDVEAPFTGTIVFEVGADDEVADDEITVGVPEYGLYGTAITGISSTSAIPTASIDHPNPDAAACLEEVRPDEPTIEVVDIAVGEDAIDATFGSENPNDAPLVVGSTFFEGTTDEAPPTELEPGETEFTVQWTPESDDERLVWEVDLSVYEYDEPLTAATPPAGDLQPAEPDPPEADDPATFAVEIVGANDPVSQGETLDVETAIENVDDGAGTQEVTLALDGEPVDSTTVDLEPNESALITLSADTDDFEPGEYVAAVSSGDETAETTVMIDAPDEPADPSFFAVTDLSAPETGDAGTAVAVEATVENEGDEAETRTVSYAVDGTVLEQESIELDGDDSIDFTFESTLPPGESTHTISTGDDEASAVIVTEPPETPNEQNESENTTEAQNGSAPTVVTA